MWGTSGERCPLSLCARNRAHPIGSRCGLPSLRDFFCLFPAPKRAVMSDVSSAYMLVWILLMFAVNPFIGL